MKNQETSPSNSALPPVGVKQSEPPSQDIPTASQSAPVGVAQTSNTGGVNGTFPSELNHWNWGAVTFTWIWGVLHGFWLSLLFLFVILPWFGPVMGMVGAIIMGIKGNEWAWKYRKFSSIEEFKAVEDSWNKWGKIFSPFPILFFILALIGTI